MVVFGTSEVLIWVISRHKLGWLGTNRSRDDPTNTLNPLKKKKIWHALPYQRQLGVGRGIPRLMRWQRKYAKLKKILEDLPLGVTVESVTALPPTWFAGPAGRQPFPSSGHRGNLAGLCAQPVMQQRRAWVKGNLFPKTIDTQANCKTQKSSRRLLYPQMTDCWFGRVPRRHVI